ncbi:MAG: hypothetical protein ACRCWR_12055 [Saezia sp.]
MHMQATVEDGDSTVIALPFPMQGEKNSYAQCGITTLSADKGTELILVVTPRLIKQ